MVGQRWEPRTGMKECGLFIQSRFAVCCQHPLFPQFECIGAHFQLQEYRDPLYAEWQMSMPLAIQRAVPKRKAEFLAGRLAARWACDAAGYPEPAEIRIGDLRAPVWPAGWRGSITHCFPAPGQGVALAMAFPAIPNGSESSIHAGIDAELVMDPHYVRMLAESALTSSERALVLASRDMDADVLVTLLFSAKESLFKALAPVVGHYFDFSAMQWLGFDQAWLRFRATQPLGRQVVRADDEFWVHWQLLTPELVMTAAVVSVEHSVIQTVQSMSGRDGPACPEV